MSQQLLGVTGKTDRFCGAHVFVLEVVARMKRISPTMITHIERITRIERIPRIERPPRSHDDRRETRRHLPLGVGSY
ncbi:hypothetical protein RSSM_06369 [Rhodopirellula sallentina SM41]|uniref:Uncharacterized protein n=1 Tax=Rhodopirellula sallentina SM41 TaxID=1263870 RepID=M5TSX7_9BACT|nr:hypothetical protein RSSM_06369 [Rhodopirellula sallentina SM41]